MNREYLHREDIIKRMVLRIMDIIKKCQSRKFCGIVAWFEPFLEDMNIQEL